ncbi:MAG: FAD:protein FMN transferase [Muribaculaceae bacterium]|nr:FAD:protein FMN transferase [Muribaculaceae bacterium]
MKRINVALTLLLAIVLIGCTPRKEFREMVCYELHTPYSVKYEAQHNLENEIRQVMRDYYHAINPFDSTSIIAHVNRNEDIAVDSIFTMVFNTAMQMAEATDGALDVTCAPYINAWGFGFKTDSTAVTQQLLDSLSQFVGYDKVSLIDNKVIKQDPRIMLNFSALGDGCACDLIATLLDNHGIENYMIEVGGEVRTAGHNSRGAAWHIGIVTPEDDPDGNNSNLQAIAMLDGRYGLATSGNYRNFYERDGRKYGHTINPATGYPAEQDVLSATVIAPTSIEADAYATALMVMGREKARLLASEHKELAYYLIYIDENDSIRTEQSPSFDKFLKK